MGGCVALMQVPKCNEATLPPTSHAKGARGGQVACALPAKKHVRFPSGVAQLMSLKTFWG